ncbi:MAG: MerR family transcriptional regulator [Deinococcales bacterium]
MVRYRIGELARFTGESVKTLRFWTNEGLLPVERGENRYRYYPLGTERRVAAVRRFQGLGFSLAEVGEILALRERGVRPCGEVRERLERHLVSTRRRVAELAALEAALVESLAWADDHLGEACEDAAAVCVIVGTSASQAATVER